MKKLLVQDELWPFKNYVNFYVVYMLTYSYQNFVKENFILDLFSSIF